MPSLVVASVGAVGWSALSSGAREIDFGTLTAGSQLLFDHRFILIQS